MAEAPIAIVTGAGAGIGRAVTLALLGAGWHVMATGRTQSSLDETRNAAGEFRHGLATHLADVGVQASVDALFAAVADRFGRLDLLFNNAGISMKGNIGDLSLQEWNATVATNLTGAFLCAQGAFRMMRDQNPRGGRIINNGSVSAHAPRPNSVAYTATKHAITGLTKSISLDGRQHDIACGQIDIGNASTAMAMPMQMGTLQADGRIAVEPVMDVATVCRAVLFMASLPLGENVQQLTVLATTMPFVGRG